MQRTEDADAVNHIEIFSYGLQRSGNHAVLLWVQAQHEGKTACFLNNIKHGDFDPYENCVQKVVYGMDEDTPTETVRNTPKHLLIYSYEDDANQMGEDRRFIESIFSGDFQNKKAHYLGRSEHSYEMLIIRDPFNFFASRLKKLDELSGEKDPTVIASNWKALARRALKYLDSPEPGVIVANYNLWVSDQAYRERLSKSVMGCFNDASMEQITYYGGGSSFDATNEKLTFSLFFKNWRKLFQPARYRQIRHYFKRMIAPPAKEMKVMERWKLVRNDKAFRAVMRDPEILELSEKLFGEMPGIRDYIKTL